MSTALLERPIEETIPEPEWQPHEIPSIEIALGQFIEPLSDEELALWWILTDRSGVQIAEFLWVDEAKPDSCYRLFPYQWEWWSYDGNRSVDQCGRSTGKSESIIAQVFAFPFNFAGQEMVIGAPEGSHLDAITDRIEPKLRQCWLTTEMMVRGRGGITHRPFKVMFQNGARVFTRLPQRSGIGFKGIHPAVMHVDEGQDVTDKAWKEVPEVVNWAIPGAQLKVHGVSKGIQDDAFWRMTQEGSGFYVHRISGMHRPTWNAEERAQKISEYGGSEESPDFKRNVYGIHGDSMHRIFLLHRLSLCQDKDQGSHYNAEEYFYQKLHGDDVVERAGGGELAVSTEQQMAAIEAMLDFPPEHRKYEVTWSGMDLGLVNDPSEIVVVAEYTPTAAERKRDERAKIAVPDPGTSRFKVLCRITLSQIPTPLQVEVIMLVIQHYRPRAFALDRTGIGVPLFQSLQQRAGASRLVTIAEALDDADTAVNRATARAALTVIKGYNFSQKVPVEIDEEKAAKMPNADIEELIAKAGIFQNAKDRATDVLRELVNDRRLLFPYDPDFKNQMNGQSFTYSSQPIDAYGRRKRAFSEGEFHLLDAKRMWALGWSQQSIEDMLAAAAERRQEPVIVQFGL